LLGENEKQPKDFYGFVNSVSFSNFSTKVDIPNDYFWTRLGRITRQTTFDASTRPCQVFHDVISPNHPL
jgi:hypothetical protein